MQDRFEQRFITSTPPTSIPRSFGHQSYWYKGTYSRGTITTSNTAPVTGGIYFTVGDLTLGSTLATVFDQYAIVAAVVRIYPIDVAIAVSDSSYPTKIVTAIDHDDAGALPLLDIQSYSTAITTNGTVGHTREIYPRVAQALYKGTFTGYGNTRTYVDAGNTDVQHYGLKYALDTSIGATGIIYNVDVDLITHWRNSR